MCEPGTVPDALRQEVARFFLEVVELRAELAEIAKGYRELAAAVEVSLDEVDDRDRAAVLEAQVRVRLILDLLLDVAYQIEETTGWEPRAVSRAAARDPRAAWPKTAWPLWADS